MPHYYFDLHDDIDTIDDEGQLLPDLAAARSKAARLLADVSQELLPRSAATMELNVAVRDEEGATVLTSTIRYSAEPAF